MNPQELAETLNMAGDRGRELNENNIEKLDAAIDIAAQNGLIIVYGHSDDNMNLVGAINDQFSCYDGGTALLDIDGLLPNRDSIDEDDELEDYFSRKKIAKSIESIWNKDGYSWIYKTNIPHATFVLLEDYDESDKFCMGIVFSFDSLRED